MKSGLTTSKRQKNYQKRIQRRKLKEFSEYGTLKFSNSIAAALTVLLLFYAKPWDESRSLLLIVFSGIFFLSAAIGILLSVRIKQQILERGAITKGARLCAIALIPFFLCGNIFATIAGLYLINGRRSIEYEIGVYMLITNITVILISLLNMFKDYVVSTFYMAIAGLAVLTVFQAIVLFLIPSSINGNHVSKPIYLISYALILTSLTGNLFSLLLGIVIISKWRRKDKEISIEWINTLQRLFKSNMSVLGMFIVVFLVMLAVCSNFTFDYSVAVNNNYSALLQSPCLKYPFGTDSFGCCQFTRIVFGARISLVVGAVVTVVPMLLGGTLGSLAGYYGGKIDNAIMRLLDIIYAVPDMLLAIAIIASLGASTQNLILALSLGSISAYARTVRATVISVSNSEYVEAARACGARDGRIILKHIIPNSLAPIIVRATMSIGSAVLSTSSLSYLGLGVEPHVPEWGNVLRAGSTYIESYPHMAIFPGLAIMLLVLAFNFFGDGLRDALDPKMK